MRALVEAVMNVHLVKMAGVWCPLGMIFRRNGTLTTRYGIGTSEGADNADIG